MTANDCLTTVQMRCVAPPDRWVPVVPRGASLRFRTATRPFNLLGLTLALVGWFSTRGEAAPLDWQQADGYRHAALTVEGPGPSGFALLPPGATGIQWRNQLADSRGLTNQVYFSGSGVAAGDVDGDGWCDLYFCGLDSPNVLYRNLGGWRFEDITARAGVACTNQASTGAGLADVDGDGDLDLVVTGIGAGARLFENDGSGRFKETTQAAGLASQAASMSIALADIDGDRDLDLYVTNYRRDTFQDEPGVRFRVRFQDNEARIQSINDHPPTPEELERYYVDPDTKTVQEHGEPDLLYRNDGGGKFTLLSWTDGVFRDEEGQPLASAPRDWGLSILARDMNGDGAPDFYNCNDTAPPDRIWINDGTGRFQALARLAVRQTCLSSMGVDFADIDRDGFDDFFVADMLSRRHEDRQLLLSTRHARTPVGDIESRPQYMRNMLYWNRGDGTYAEIAQLSGVDATDWSWSAIFLDVDLDGYEDLLVTTGLGRSQRDAQGQQAMDRLRSQRTFTREEFFVLRAQLPRLESPNQAWRNRGDRTFEDVGAKWGFDSKVISHGMALADLDRDGDQDVVINTLNAAPLVYRNLSSAPRLAVRLQGQAPNTRGIGARIHVSGGPLPQSQEIIAGGRYLSSDDPMRVFAAGPTGRVFAIEVVWRSGARSRVSGAQPSRVYEIIEPTAAAPAAAAAPGHPAPPPSPWFEDMSRFFNHRHPEEPYDDFAVQPLLPRQLSQLGPGVCLGDLDADGADDILIGSGRGGSPMGYINRATGQFARVRLDEMLGALPGDTTSILTWPSGRGGNILLVGVSSYETSAPLTNAVQLYEFWAGGLSLVQSLPFEAGALGPVAVADVDGDGDLDIFAGARVIPGRYPEPADAILYRDQRGRWEPDPTQPFVRLGLISDALFTDLDADGRPELVLACEWGPIRIFANQRGNFHEVTPTYGLDAYQGWWNSVAAGDFDGDGRMDLVAGNWGRNSKYQFYAREPLRLYYADWDGNGTLDLLETRVDPYLKAEVPWARWETLGQSIPPLQVQIPTLAAYSTTRVDRILALAASPPSSRTVTTLDSMVFLNRHTQFETRPLPWSAQLSPVFGLAVADLDHDGRMDIFAAQNFFGVELESSRHDAGRGVWLRGDGQGGFTEVPASESGLLVYGEGRGAAVADFDRDGRLDLVVAQNGAQTKFYRNHRANPGLRVRLQGPSGNPAGVGASLQWIYGTQRGPLHEVSLGAGYWSQSTLAPVLARPPTNAVLAVRWQRPEQSLYEIPATAREVLLDVSGSIKVLK